MSINLCDLPLFPGFTPLSMTSLQRPMPSTGASFQGSQPFAIPAAMKTGTPSLVAASAVQSLGRPSLDRKDVNRYRTTAGKVRVN